MEQDILQIQNLLDRYKRGDYTVLEDGEKLVENISSSLKTLLYVSLSNFALLRGNISKAENYTKEARAHYNAESQYIDEPSLIIAESLPFFYQGKLVRSLELLQNYQEKHPQIQFLIAECEYWKGNFEEARNFYQKALLLCEEDENLQEDAQLCLLGQARCDYRLGNLEKAEKFLATLSQTQDGAMNDDTEESHILAAGELVRVLSLQNKTEEAHHISKNNLAANMFQHPYKKASVMFSLGLAKLSTEEWNDAYNELCKVIDLPIRKFEKLESYLLLGDIETKRNYFEQARKWYHEAAQFPETFLGKDALKKLQKLTTASEISSEDKVKDTVSKTAKEALMEQLMDAETKPVIDAVTDTLEANAATVTPIEANATTGTPIETNATTATEANAEETIWNEIPLTAILAGIDMMDVIEQIQKRDK